MLLYNKEVRMNKSNTYNSVIITKINDRKSRYTCECENGYLSYLKSHPDMVDTLGDVFKYNYDYKLLIEYDRTFHKKLLKRIEKGYVD